MIKLNAYKRSLGFITAAFAFAAFTTGCSSSDSCESGVSSESSSVSETTDTTEKSTLKTENLSDVNISYDEIFSDRDRDPSYDSIDAEIKLNGSSADIDGDGASADGSVITITSEGVYRITGTLENGQIVVDAKGEKVQLVLDGAEIICKDASPVKILNADKTFITLENGSVNSLTDKSSEDKSDDSPNAGLFSKDSLTINGEGSLVVTSENNDGIRCKDDVVITGGEITIDAESNGIKVKDYIAAESAKVTVTSGNDGIRASNAKDESLGFIYIASGSFDVTSGGDGFSAASTFYSENGDINIVAGGGNTKSNKEHSDDFGGFGGGMRGDFSGKPGELPTDENGDFVKPDFSKGGEDMPELPSDFDKFLSSSDAEVPADKNNLANIENLTNLSDSTEEESSDTSEDESSSTKGIKGTDVTINGGFVSIDSADDALHANGNITITGGEISLSAGDDGIHADSDINISEGKVTVKTSYEGFEGAVINISGGTVEVTASDDGFNGSDGTPQGGMGTNSANVDINITGGTVYVNSNGDGLDSNGNMTISGGTVIVNGPENGANGALDTNGTFTVAGGTLIAAGSSGMAESPEDSSTQNCVSATFDTVLSGGTLVTLLDDSGKEIVSFAPEKSFGNIVISTPDLKTGETYTFYTGGSSSEEEKYGLYKTGGYKNDGKEAGSFTVESSISYIGKQSGGFGKGGFGGGRGNFDGGMPDGFNGEFPTDENGNPAMPEFPTDENGNFSMPDGFKPPTGQDGNFSKRGDMSRNGSKRESSTSAE